MTSNPSTQRPRRSDPRSRSKALCPLWAALCVLCVALSGCTTLRLDNSKRLLARPDFPAARAAAPEWCRDALKTINALEAQLESK